MTMKALNLAASTPDVASSTNVSYYEMPLTASAANNASYLPSLRSIADAQRHIAKSIAIQQRAAIVRQTSQELVERAMEIRECKTKIT